MAGNDQSVTFREGAVGVGTAVGGGPPNSRPLHQVVEREKDGEPTERGSEPAKGAPNYQKRVLQPPLALIPLHPEACKSGYPVQAKPLPITLGRTNLALWWWKSCPCPHYCRLHCRPVAQNVRSLSKVMVQLDSKGGVHIAGKNPHLITITSPERQQEERKRQREREKKPGTSSASSISASKAQYQFKPEPASDGIVYLHCDDIISIGRRGREPWLRFKVVPRDGLPGNDADGIMTSKDADAADAAVRLSQPDKPKKKKSPTDEGQDASTTPPPPCEWITTRKRKVDEALTSSNGNSSHANSHNLARSSVAALDTGQSGAVDDDGLRARKKQKKKRRLEDDDIDDNPAPAASSIQQSRKSSSKKKKKKKKSKSQRSSKSRKGKSKTLKSSYRRSVYSVPPEELEARTRAINNVVSNLRLNASARNNQNNSTSTSAEQRSPHPHVHLLYQDYQTSAELIKLSQRGATKIAPGVDDDSQPNAADYDIACQINNEANEDDDHDHESNKESQNRSRHQLRQLSRNFATVLLGEARNASDISDARSMPASMNVMLPASMRVNQFSFNQQQLKRSDSAPEGSAQKKAIRKARPGENGNNRDIFYARDALVPSRLSLLDQNCCSSDEASWFDEARAQKSTVDTLKSMEVDERPSSLLDLVERIEKFRSINKIEGGQLGDSHVGVPSLHDDDSVGESRRAVTGVNVGDDSAGQSNGTPEPTMLSMPMPSSEVPETTHTFEGPRDIIASPDASIASAGSVSPVHDPLARWRGIVMNEKPEDGQPPSFRHCLGTLVLSMNQGRSSSDGILLPPLLGDHFYFESQLSTSDGK